MPSAPRLRRQHDGRRHRSAAAARRRRRAAARRQPRRLGPAGNGGGHAVRAGPHLRARPGRSARPTPFAASTTWCWPAPRPCRVSACRPPCCPDGWPPTGSPEPSTSRVATHIGRWADMIRSELDAAGVHDPALRERLRTLPGAQRRARQHLLPRDPAAGARAAPCGARAVRVRPSSRRHPRRLRSHREHRRARRTASAAGHAAVQSACPASGLRRRPDPAGGGAHRAPVRHPLGDVRRLPDVDADGPDRDRLSGPGRVGALHARLGRGDRTADAAGARHRRPARGGRTVRRRAGKGVPAHQLPARRRRGPAARPGVSARRRAGRPPASTATC